MITQGATAGLLLCASIFGKRDMPILMDEVSYSNTLSVLKDDVKKDIVAGKIYIKNIIAKGPSIELKGERGGAMVFSSKICFRFAWQQNL